MSDGNNDGKGIASNEPSKDSATGAADGAPTSAPDYRPEAVLLAASATAGAVALAGCTPVRPGTPSNAAAEKPAIISYVKPSMELYLAEDKYTPPAAPGAGKTSRTTCSCNLVCTCERVSACGCNLVHTRVPVDVSLVCSCNTVAVCTCNMVSTCTCNRVATSVCSCNLVCTCDKVCTCERVGGGSSGRSVCRCVPVIH